MSIAMDILSRVKAFGAELILKPDGTGIKARNISVGLLDEVRQHKQEIMELLKANSTSGIAVSVPKVNNLKENRTSDTILPQTYTRLELADAALRHLIPDEQQRRKIRALAEADARNWRFLGSAHYQHILAGNILDAVEKATGKLICFRCNPDGDFIEWHIKELGK